MLCVENLNDFDYSIYDEGETKYKENFGPGGGDVGCFGMIVMFFVSKKVEKINKNRKSLISRNRGFKTELKKSVRCVASFKHKIIKSFKYSEN